MTDAALNSGEAFIPATPAAVDSFIAESLDGFHEGGSARTLVFTVRQPEARWVARNLMPGMKAEDDGNGIRVTVHTTAVGRVARYVVSLGAAAECETPELGESVVSIARGALGRIRTTTGSRRG